MSQDAFHPNDQGFLANNGRLLNQSGGVNQNVLYIWSAGNGINVQVRSNGFSYDTYQFTGQNGTANFHRVDVNLLNISPSASLIPMDAAEAHINIYDPHRPERNATALYPFGKIKYEGIYPGIDMELSIAEVAGKKQFKYDFIAAPGADMDLIEIEYLGFDNAQVDGDEIVFELSTGTLRESIPLSYLSPGGETVDVSYKGISQSGSALRVGMALPEGRSLPADKSLTIDPTAALEWGTYYGGEATEVNNSVAIDSLGILYIAGTTSSLSGMASEGSHQGVFSGVNSDAFLARFNQHGLRQWATYYGGSGDDEGLVVALSNFRHVYLAGNTTSTDSIGSTESYQPENAGDTDGFIARFDRHGALLWDSFLGGTNHDEITTCVVLNNGSVYVAGNTMSATFATPQDSIPISLSGTYSGGVDAFIGRFSADGIFEGGRYYGGSGDDVATSIAFGLDSALYLGGYTDSESGIAYGTSFQQNPGSGVDGFLAMFDFSHTPVWGSYFGSEGNERITGIVTDTNRVYLTGYTDMEMDLADTTSHQPVFGGVTDAFLMRLDSLQNIAWFTYLGGDSSDVANDISIDRDGEVYITGTTYSTNNIDDNDSTGTTYAGGGDAFVARYKPSGEKVWGRYHGGNAHEEGLGVAAFGYTAIFYAGHTASTGGAGLAESNGEFSELHQNALMGAQDGFLARVNQEKSTPPAFICSGNCEPSGASSGGDGDVGNWVPSPIGVCLGDSIQITASSGALGNGAKWIWYESECGVTDMYIGEGNSIWVAPTTTTVYFVRGESVDDVSDCRSVVVHVDFPPTASISEPDTACVNGSASLSADGAMNFAWTGPAGFESEEQHPLIDSLSANQAGVYTVTVSTQFGCTDTASTSLHLLPAPEFDLVATDVTCMGFEDGTATATVTTENTTIFWPHADTEGLTFENLAPGTYTAVATDMQGCSSSLSVEITEPLHPIDSLHTIDAWCDDEKGSLLMYLSGNTGPYTIDWSPGELSGPIVHGLAAGAYSATVTDANGCTYFAEAQIGNLGFFTASISPADSIYLEIDLVEVLNVNVIPTTENLSYLWEPAEGLSCTDCASPTANPEESTTYYVTVTSIQGCSDVDSVFVEREVPPSVLFIPTIFSPNGDGLNDDLCVLSDRVVHLKLEIYNRWGEMVFQSNDQGSCWDGTYEGAPVASGAYVYHLQASLDDGELVVNSGNLSVIR